MHPIRLAVAAVAAGGMLAAAAALVPGPGGALPARAALVEQSPLQGVSASGVVTLGTGVCFPDAVLVDCAGVTTHQLRGPGGAAFFAPYLGQWIEVTGAEQECQPGSSYIDVVTLQTAANPCGQPATPTPDATATSPATAVPPPTATPSAGNLAIGKQLFASTTIPGTDPAFAADGDPNTFWSSVAGRDPYYAARNVQWIYIDLGQDHSVQEMKMLWTQWRHPRGYAVYAWLDMFGGWKILASTDRGDSDDHLVLPDAVEARYFMLWLVNPGLMGSAYELREWEIGGQTGVLTTNVAAGKGAVALNEMPGFEAGKATDADDATAWHSATKPSWVYVNLGAATTIDRARLKWEPGLHATRHALYAWNGVAWAPVTSRNAGAGGDEVVRFFPVRTQYLLLYAIEGPGAHFGLREFEIYDVAPAGGGGGGAPVPPGPPVPLRLAPEWQAELGGGRPMIVPDGVDR